MRAHTHEGADRDTVSRSNLSAKRLIVVGGTVVALAAGSAFGAGPAFADTTTNLVGSVTDAGAAVSDVEVEIIKYDETDGQWENYDQATTATDGTWSLDGENLSDGRYATAYYVSDSKQALYSQNQAWDGTVISSSIFFGGTSYPSTIATQFTVSGDSVSQANLNQTLARNAGAATVVLKDEETGAVINGATDGSNGQFYAEVGIDASGKTVSGNGVTASGADFTGTLTLGHLAPASYAYSFASSSNYNNQAPVDPFTVTAGATANLGAVFLNNGPDVTVADPGVITVAGTPKVGTLLTANIPANNATKITYFWYSSEGFIAGANAQTFTPTADLIGKQIFVGAFLSAPGFGTTSLGSDVPTPPVSIGDPNQATVSISGKAKFDQTLKAVVGNASVAGAKYSYQWYANGAVIAGADSSSYTVKKSQTGASLVVSVSSVAQGHTAAVIPSAAVAVAKDIVKLTATSTKTISKSTKPKVKVSVKVGNSKVTATGKVKVYYSSKKYKTVSVTSKSKSAKSVTLPKLSKGKHTIKVVFPASTHYASKTVKIKVTVTK